MEKKDLKVGQLLYYYHPDGRIPCQVVEIGEKNFTVRFFEDPNEPNIHGLGLEGDRLQTVVRFDCLVFAENKDYCVKPTNKTEILSIFDSNLRGAKYSLERAKKKVEYAKAKIKHLEDVLENINTNIPDD